MSPDMLEVFLWTGLTIIDKTSTLDVETQRQQEWIPGSIVKGTVTVEPTNTALTGQNSQMRNKQLGMNFILRSLVEDHLRWQFLMWSQIFCLEQLWHFFITNRCISSSTDRTEVQLLGLP
jgi:hypothetical protein